MPKFMLILHGPPNWLEPLSSDDLRRVLGEYRSWIDDLRAAGRVVVSDKLKDEGGRVLSSQRGKLSVVDGPYSEAKEVVGGFIMIRAADYDEAVALARTIPHLAFGRVEVRQVDPQGCGQDE